MRRTTILLTLGNAFAFVQRIVFRLQLISMLFFPLLKPSQDRITFAVPTLIVNDRLFSNVNAEVPLKFDVLRPGIFKNETAVDSSLSQGSNSWKGSESLLVTRFASTASKSSPRKTGFPIPHDFPVGIPALGVA